MISTYIAIIIFTVYVLYKSFYLIRTFVNDKDNNQSSVAKAHGKETFVMLGLCLLILWLGLVPRQHSSGGKQRLQGISKRGD